MNFEIWLAYLATVLAFMITLGPSHLLMLSNSMTHGFRRSLATATGDLTANALQMLAAGLGLAALLASYGLSASWLAGKLKGRATVLVHRIGSVFMIGAAVMLGLKTLRDTS